jgi:hypothetical protein
MMQGIVDQNCEATLSVAVRNFLLSVAAFGATDHFVFGAVLAVDGSDRVEHPFYGFA